MQGSIQCRVQRSIQQSALYSVVQANIINVDFLRSQNLSCEKCAQKNGQKNTKHVQKVGKNGQKIYLHSEIRSPKKGYAI